MWFWLFLGSLLPIWRRAPSQEGLNTWQYLQASLSEPMKHIPTETAILRAREAWLSRN